MLVLSRRDNEAIVLRDLAGHEVFIRLRIEGGKIKLYFEAPPAVRIIRAELLERDPA